MSKQESLELREDGNSFSSYTYFITLYEHNLCELIIKKLNENKFYTKLEYCNKIYNLNI